MRRQDVFISNCGRWVTVLKHTPANQKMPSVPVSSFAINVCEVAAHFTNFEIGNPRRVRAADAVANRAPDNRVGVLIRSAAV
jgi:hypothetical protein